MLSKWDVALFRLLTGSWSNDVRAEASNIKTCIKSYPGDWLEWRYVPIDEPVSSHLCSGDCCFLYLCASLLSAMAHWLLSCVEGLKTAAWFQSGWTKNWMNKANVNILKTWTTCGWSKCVISRNHLCLYWQLVHAASAWVRPALNSYLRSFVVLKNWVKFLHMWHNYIIKMIRSDAWYSTNHITKHHLSKCLVYCFSHGKRNGLSIIIINVV